MTKENIKQGKLICDIKHLLNIYNYIVKKENELIFERDSLNSFIYVNSYTYFNKTTTKKLEDIKIKYNNILYNYFKNKGVEVR